MRPVAVREALRGLAPSEEERVAAARRYKKLREAWARVPPGSNFEAAAPDRRWFNFTRAHPDRPAPTIPDMAVVFHPDEPRLFAIPEIRRLCGFPDDFCPKA